MIQQTAAAAATSLPDLPWWQKCVLYQIYPLSFQDSNDDGLGDLPGITRRLGYLKDLGIGGVWISPFYDSVLQYDYGYGPANLRAIHPLFGSMADFDRLLAAAHSLGIRIIMEWAVTNTSVWSSWFLESRTSRDNPKADWYIWTDHPNNWVSHSGGSAWHYCPERNQYYLGLFFKEHAELNYRNPAVVAAMLEAMEFWVAKGIDGFRIDTVNLYVKDAGLRDNPPADVDATTLFDPDDPVQQSRYLQYLIPDARRFRHIHDQDQPETLEIMAAMRDLCDRYDREFLLLGETDANSPFGAALCDAGMTAAFNFSLLRCRWDAQEFGRVLAEEQTLLDAYRISNVFSNHDTRRAISRHRTGDERETWRRGRVLAALLLTLKGIPMVYYGEELGLYDADIPMSELTDPISARYHYLRGDTGLLRDLGRGPMPWDATPTAGFTGDRPWLRLPENYRTANVSAEEADPASLLNFYRRLIGLRNASPALQAGDYTLLEAGEGGCLAYTRGLGPERWLIVLNFTAQPAEFSQARHGLGGLSWQPVILEGAVDRAGQSLTIAPYGVNLLRIAG